MAQKTADMIKVWAIILGFLSLSSLLTLSVYPIASTAGIVSVIAIVLGLGVLYAGVQINSMAISTVNLIFWAKFAWLVVNFLLSLTVRINVTRLLIIIVEGIIMWYLIQSVKKLAPMAPVAK